MDLIPSLSVFNILASIPLVFALTPFMKSFIIAMMKNPIVSAVYNTSLVVLESTELVWRPVLKLAVVLVKTLLNALAIVVPQVKAIIRAAFNVTVPIIRKIQEMGMSVSQTLSAVFERMVEIGDALIVLARGLSKGAFYAVRGVSAVVGSFETLANLVKKMLFAPNQITMQDLSGALMPFLLVCSLIAFVVWWKKAPMQKTVEAYQPRRSSRLARKRAMLYADGFSDALLTCKKSSTTSSTMAGGGQRTSYL